MTLPSLHRNSLQLLPTEMPRWYPAQGPEGKVRGVCLMLHGLNLRPSKMESLAELWQQWGFHVLRGSLQGHGEDLKKMSSKMSNSSTLIPSYAELWLEDFHFYLDKAQSLKLPLYFLGYSLGGLVMATASIQRALPFEKIVLMAPPLFTRWYAAFPKFCAQSFPPTYKLPSLNLSSYANGVWTPLGHYRGLFELQATWQSHFERSILTTTPSLILVDPKDELVSYPQLKRFLEQHPRLNCKLQTLSIKKSKLPLTYHHLIIDSQVLGGALLWNQLQHSIWQFLSLRP